LQTEEDADDELNDIDKIIVTVIEESLMQFTEKR